MIKWLLSLLLLIPNIALAQANIAGLLFASNFANWNVPQGNAGPMSWSSPSFCRVTSGGVTFNAFTTGVPVRLVDTGNPSLSETVTPNFVNISEFGCQISAAAANPHKSFYFATATAGLNEAVAYAGVALNQVIVTPAWSNLGGITNMITSAQGNSSVTILDQRSSVIVPYVWSGSTYVAQPFSSTTGKVVNGISYSANYPGATLDVRVDLCLADAQNLTNGNSSGICSSAGDGGTQSIMSTMTPPNATTGAAVTWLLPTNCNWNAVSGFTGFGAIIKIANGETVLGTAAPNACKIGNNAGTNAVLATVWVPSTTAYYNMGGFDARNTGVAVGSGATVYIQGGADNNYIHDLSIQNYIPNETGLLITGGCCSQNYHNVTVQNNFTGGSPVVINGPQGPINFFGGTFGHPGTGFPIFLCEGNPFASVNFYGWYGEPSTSDFTTVPMQIDGCGSVGMFSSYLTQIQSGNSDTSAGINITNTFDTALTLQNFYMAGWHNPPVAVTNANPGELASYSANAQGIVPRFTTGKDSAGTYNSANGYLLNGSNLIPTINLGDSVAGNGNPGQLTIVPANPTTTVKFLASQSTGPVAIPQSPTCQHNGAGGASIACTWSASPSVGQTAMCYVSTALPGTFSIHDTASNTYTAANSQYNSSTTGAFTQIFYAPITGVPATTTFAYTGSPTSSVPELSCITVSGIPASPAIDGLCNGDSSTAALSCGSLTTTVNGDYVFCGGAAHNGSTVMNPGPLFTIGLNPVSNLSMYRIVNPAATITPTMSITGTLSASTMSCASVEAGGATQLPFLQTAYYQTVKDSGSALPQEPAINLIPGTDTTISCVDNPGVSTDCTWVASSTAATAWSAITASTNTGQALILGAGSTMTTTGTGTNQATSISTNAGTATGAVNVLAVSILPTSLTLSNLLGVPITFIPNLANTTTTPTLTVNSLTATTIVKGTSTALASGDLALNTPTTVIYNGTNFVLQNPQSLVTQIGASGNFGLTGSNGFTAQNIRSNSATASLNIQSGQDGGNATEGILTLRGGTTSSATGTGGNAVLEAGAATSTANNTGMVQGFANVQQSFKVAAALAATFEAVAIGTTDDVVIASPLGGFTNVGIAQTVGASNGQLFVVSHGKTTARFDGTPVIGDLACYPPASTGTIGLLHDNGSGSACTLGESAGPITGQVSGSGSGATATVLLR